MGIHLGSVNSSGELGLRVIRGNPFGRRAAAHPLNVCALALPRPGLSREVNLWRLRNLPNVWRGLWRIWLAWAFGIPTHYGAVYHRVRRGPLGTWVDYGLASLRVVTDAGVAYLAACLDNTNEPENLKFHGFGTGTTAEATTDTALVTELTTQYNPDNTRPTGSQAHSTNTYTTVATLSPDSGGTIAVTEHGIVSQAATGGGTLLDRSKFAAVNLTAPGDSLQTTYVYTQTSGG